MAYHLHGINVTDSVLKKTVRTARKFGMRNAKKMLLVSLFLVSLPAFSEGIIEQSPRGVYHFGDTLTLSGKIFWSVMLDGFIEIDDEEIATSYLRIDGLDLIHAVVMEDVSFNDNEEGTIRINSNVYSSAEFDAMSNQAFQSASPSTTTYGYSFFDEEEELRIIGATLSATIRNHYNTDYHSETLDVLWDKSDSKNTVALKFNNYVTNVETRYQPSDYPLPLTINGNYTFTTGLFGSNELASWEGSLGITGLSRPLSIIFDDCKIVESDDGELERLGHVIRNGQIYNSKIFEGILFP
jgi:hypothetical protein